MTYRDDTQDPRTGGGAPVPPMREKVVVAGQGYVGLPVAMRAVEVGYRVVGFDSNADRVKRLATGESYVEDVSNDTLRSVLATNRYSASSDARACGGIQETRDARVSLVDLTRDVVAGADAVVLLTDHDELDLELVVTEARYVLDTRFRLTGPNVERL